MRWKVDKAKLDDMLRLLRRYKRTHDNDIYRLVIATEDDVMLDKKPYSVAGSHVRDICNSMLFFGQPSNARFYEVLNLCGIEVVETEPYISEEGLPF